MATVPTPVLMAGAVVIGAVIFGRGLSHGVRGLLTLGVLGAMAFGLVLVLRHTAATLLG